MEISGPPLIISDVPLMLFTELHFAHVSFWCKIYSEIVDYLVYFLLPSVIFKFLEACLGANRLKKQSDAHDLS